mgnify:CR=1 FL=1
MMAEREDRGLEEAPLKPGDLFQSKWEILRLLGREGSGADIVSGGELFRALRAGIDPKKIVYAGVGKRRDEIEYALKMDILMFNVESG